MALIVSIAVIVIVVIALAGLVVIPVVISKNFLNRRFEQEQYGPDGFSISSEKIAVVTDDGLNLAAWRVWAKGEVPKGTVIVVSGIMNPSVTAYFGFAKMFADNGWDTLLIEMRARGLSEGATIGLGMTEWLDVKAGVDLLSADERVRHLPIVAMGTSMGGSAALTAAGELPRIDAVLSLSAFTTFTDMAVELLPGFGVPKAIAKIDRPFINLVIGFQLGFAKLKYTPIDGIKKLGNRPLLLMHSTGDSEVPFSQYEKLLFTAQSMGVPVTAFTREGDHHFICSSDLLNPTEDAEFSSAILSFLEMNVANKGV